MSETKRCPQCQAEIPAGAPEGLCPQCLLQAALDPKTADAEVKTAAYTPSGAGFVPPTPEVLQAAFPQLEILELLGKGGMGAVYKAKQRGLDRLVAVKILPPEFSQDPAFAKRFLREAKALAMLSHPNIVGIHDIGQTPVGQAFQPDRQAGKPDLPAGGFCYFVMEFVDGVNLRQAMRAGNLTPAEALKIVPQICDALQFAHDEGIVHRDIKPENILLDKKGRVKIADFGLAKLLGKTPHDISLTGTQQVMGTMHYMAPEQIEGARDVDHRADIYSLGVTFYEMLTGELPIGRFAAPSKKVQIDVRLDEVVLRSLEKAPELRYQHASEIKTEVESIARAPASIGPEPLTSNEAAPVKKQAVARPQTSYARGVGIPMLIAFGAFLVIGIAGLLFFVLLGGLRFADRPGPQQHAEMPGAGPFVEARPAMERQAMAGWLAIILLPCGTVVFLGLTFLVLNIVWLIRRNTGGEARAAGPAQSNEPRPLQKEPGHRNLQASEIKTEVEGIVSTPPAPAGATPDAHEDVNLTYATLSPGKRVLVDFYRIETSADRAHAMAALAAMSELEQAVLENWNYKARAVKVYRQKTGAGVKEAMVAVEEIARKHGLRFPPVTVGAHIVAATVIVLCVAILGLWVWIYSGLSPIVAIPIMLLFAIPNMVTAWKKWGTPAGYWNAVAAVIIILLSPVGIPIVTFLIDPEPTLNRLYELTGATPGPHDAWFLRVVFGGGLLGMLAWLVWFIRKKMVELRGGSKSPPGPEQPGQP